MEAVLYLLCLVIVIVVNLLVWAIKGMVRSLQHWLGEARKNEEDKYDQLRSRHDQIWLLTVSINFSVLLYFPNGQSLRDSIKSYDFFIVSGLAIQNFEPHSSDSLS